MILNFGYGSDLRTIALGIIMPDPGGYEGTASGGGDDDTQVMTTREGMTDPKWFGFIKED